MFVLHVDLTLKPGAADTFLSTYRDVLCPAIARQPGFIETALLLSRPPKAGAHRLVIVFENERLQQLWVATSEHRDAWTQMKPSIAAFSADAFEIIASNLLPSRAANA